MIKILTILTFFTLTYAQSKGKCEQALSRVLSLKSLQETQLPLVKDHITPSLFAQMNQGFKNLHREFENAQKNKYFEILNPQLEKAVEQIPVIIDFVNQNFSKNSSETNLYEKTILESVLVTFSKHIPAYLDSSTPSQAKDWGRIKLILEAIAQFDSQKGHFSFYKIKRAITGRYSLREYILCK